jgi:glycosidase
MNLLVSIALTVLFLFANIQVLPVWAGTRSDLGAEGRGHLKNDVLYYIQVDRFVDGDPTNNIPLDAFARDNSASESVQNHREANRVLLPYLYDPTHRYINLYWGGDLAGITQKLGYLKALGVTQLVLSPIQDVANGLSYNPGQKGYLHDRVDPKEETYNEFYAHASAGFNRSWTRDWWEVDEHFGCVTIEDAPCDRFQSLRTLLTAAKEHEIGIILEFNLNHTSPYRVDNSYSDFDPSQYQQWLVDQGAVYQQGELVAQYYDAETGEFNPQNWFHSYQSIDYNRPNSRMLEQGTVDGLPDLNHQNSAVTQYLLNALEFWLTFNQEQATIAGFYLTGIPYIPLDFWQELEARIRSINPNAILIADYGDGGYRNIQSIQWYADTQDFDLVNYSFSVATRRFFGRDRGWDGRTIVLREDALGKAGQYYNFSLPEKLLHFILNPSQSLEIPRSSLEIVQEADAKAWINFLEAANQTRLLTYYPKMTQKAYASAIKFIFTSPGIPLLFYGTETALAVPYHIDHRSPFGAGGDPFNEPMMIWENNAGWDQPLHDLTQKLGTLRQQYPLLRYGQTTFVFPPGSKADKDLFMVRQRTDCSTKDFPPNPELNAIDSWGSCPAILYAYSTEGGDFLLQTNTFTQDNRLDLWERVEFLDGDSHPITENLVPLHLDPEESQVLIFH